MFLKGPSKKLLFTNRETCFFLTFSFVFLSLFSLRTEAQVYNTKNNPVLFRGIVFDGVTQDPVAGVKYLSDSIRYTDTKGMFSFYAHLPDTIVFEHSGYRKFFFYISDTLRAREYATAIYLNPDTLMIGEVVIIPHMGDLKYEILSSEPKTDFQAINAANNLKISAYQGLTGMNKLGDPSSNYHLLQEKQKIDTYEKGGIPSAQMVALSPFTIIPAIYLLLKGMPEAPPPPEPYLSPKELEELKKIHDSVVKGVK